MEVDESVNAFQS